METITYEKMLAAIQHVAQGKDEFVYKADERVPGNSVNVTCFNVEPNADGKLVGSCIIGQALIHLGVHPQWFEDNERVGSGVTTTVQTLDDLGVLHVTSKALDLAGAVQSAQDRGTPWGLAIARGVVVADRYDGVDV